MVDHLRVVGHVGFFCGCRLPAPENQRFRIANGWQIRHHLWKGLNRYSLVELFQSCDLAEKIQGHLS